ncbi:Signal recognition particle 19 kDa protein [Spatholobus suberectus]|nr:Signal recognition particle 19 kDa protein [Spatholobus suberectus]
MLACCHFCGLLSLGPDGVWLLKEGSSISPKHAKTLLVLKLVIACSYLKIPFTIEINKAYPRDFMQRGRVRATLKKENGTLYNSSISSRKQLMLRVAEMVPRHHGRTKKQETASTSTAGPSNKSGKGGKKRR